MHFQASFPNCQCYQQMSWVVGEQAGVLWRRSLDCEGLCVCCAPSEVTYHESSSIHSSNLAVLLGAAGEMLTVVGWVVTSQILSMRWEAKSRLPSVWLARIACTCGVRRLAQMMRRKSSGTSDARPLRCQRNCDGFRLPISSC